MLLLPVIPEIRLEEEEEAAGHRNITAPGPGVQGLQGRC